MTKKIEDGGPAFPCTNEQFTHGNPNVGDAWSGLSLRDWFAGQALAGNLSAENMGVGWIERLRSPDNARLMADRAYQMADAMLAARKAGEA